jgi:hypothetical protein
MQLFTFLNTKSNDFFEKVLQMCGYKKSSTNMKSLIIILSLFFVGHTSYCQDWVPVCTAADGGKWYIKSTYVKKDGFENSGDNIRIWRKIERKKTTIKKNGKSLTYTNVQKLQLIVVDCSDRKIKYVATVVYNSQGEVIDSYNFEEYEQEWNDVVPDSVDEATLDKICELFN